MRNASPSRALLVFALLLLSLARASAQNLLPTVSGAVATGLRPLGMDIFRWCCSQLDTDVVVANSGENSVSIYRLSASESKINFSSEQKVLGIPSPYDVAACPDTNPPILPIDVRMGLVGTFLITSPSDNSVRVLRTPAGVIAGVIPVGPQPYSVDCFVDRLGKLYGAVSNAGDNSATIFEVASFRVIATIPNVPASQRFHGIYGPPDSRYSTNRLFVAGTDANVVTVISLDTFNVLTQIPVARPTAITATSFEGATIAIASAGSNEVKGYSSLEVASTLTYRNVPNPEDMTFDHQTRLFIATNGGRDSLTYWNSDEDNRTVRYSISGIPGAAALAEITLNRCLSFFGRTGGCISFEQHSGLLVTSTTTNQLFFVQLFRPGATSFSVVNSASFATVAVAPGSLATAFGPTGAGQALTATPSPEMLPTIIGGVQLRLGGSLIYNNEGSGLSYSPAGSVLARLLFVGPTQINFQVPPNGIVPGTIVPAQILKADGASLLTTLAISASYPGMFTIFQNGRGQGAVLNDDYSQNGSPQTILGARPARRGSVVQIYATGAGETTPTLLAGEPAPVSGNPLILTNVQPAVTMGGVSARVQFSG
ncbi:MAG: hypothetical protein EXQ56_04320, partial [Acidobacteria bacterium]|nr:hypothetical protein [Acidobacteriota bacterium]